MTKKSASASDWANRFGRQSTAPTPTPAPVSPAEVESAETPAPTKTTRRRPAKKTANAQKATQSAQKAAPRARKSPASAEQPDPAPVAPVAAVMSRRRAPAKRPVTYRLTDDVLDLVDAAVLAATERGERLTKEEAVAVAIRRAYARLRK